jgi:hypothetical protein
VGALSSDRQSPTMAKTAITTEIHQSFDIHVDLAPQIAFDLKIRINDLTYPSDLIFI